MKTRLLLLIPCALLVGCPTQVDQSAAPPINPAAVVIGLLQTQATGPIVERELSARLAISEINAAGGVNGQPLDLRVAYDDLNDVAAGVASAQSLVNSGVVAIVGANTSVVTIPVAQQVTIPANIALISPGATSPLITTLADNGTVFRIPPSDALQGKVLAQQVWNEGHTSVAIFALNEPYGNGLTQSFSQAFQALGGSIQVAIAAPANQTSGYDSQIASLYAAGTPGTLMMFSLAQQSAQFLRELVAAKGSLPPLYGVDANMGLDFTENAPPAVAGMRGTTPGSSANTPAYQHFLQAFEAAAGYAPDPNVQNAYDAVYTIALAMQKAGQNTRPAVIAHLPDVAGAEVSGATEILPGQFALAISTLNAGGNVDYEGASGAIDWDSNGDPTVASYLYEEIEASPSGLQIVTLKTLTP